MVSALEATISSIAFKLCFQFQVAPLQLGVIVMAAAAAKRWGPAGAASVGGCLATLWNALAQPLLFALIGAAVDLQSLTYAVVGKGLALLTLGLVAGACTRPLFSST